MLSKRKARRIRRHRRSAARAALKDARMTAALGGDTVNINTRPRASQSAGRSYRLVSPFQLPLLPQPPIRVGCSFARPEGLLLLLLLFSFFFFLFRFVIVGPVRPDREGSAPTWLDLLTLPFAPLTTSTVTTLSDLPDDPAVFARFVMRRSTTTK